MQANVKAQGGPGAAAGAPGPARAVAVAGGGDARRGEGGDPLTDLELAAWRGMLRAHAGVTRRLDEELRVRHGLSLGAYEVLMLVGTAPRRRLRISELSQGTLLSVSGMSRMIDRLEREGLAVRESCADDRRGAEVVLTTAGRGRLRAARATHLAGVRAEFLARFDDAELALLGGLWDRIAPPGG